jgi:SMI1/KNR4 family protein SUKH-1
MLGFDNLSSTLPRQEASPMISSSPLEELFASSEVAGGASESTIAEAEAALGVQFPPSYRSFLAQFGAALGRSFGHANPLFDRLRVALLILGDPSLHRIGISLRSQPH